MLTLSLRHVASGITLDFEPSSNYPSNRSLIRIIEWDLREATMGLVDKVAAAKGISPMEVMAKSPEVQIVAKWTTKEIPT